MGGRESRVGDVHVPELSVHLLRIRVESRVDQQAVTLRGIEGAASTGVNLRLPGYGSAGPTLEIFTYSPCADCPPPAVNRPGLVHLAFEVASVEDARHEILAAGGGSVGVVVTLTASAGARVTWCCVTDPEGSIVELQAWGAGE